jgi:hypothetical protein
MRLSLIAASLFSAFAALPALAADEPASPHTVTGNMSIVSDYRFRGISQTYKLPALQGGIDYSHASGVYVGTWLSSVSGNQYLNGASLEMDAYAGYKLPVGDFTFDAGGLYYYYPGAHYSVTAKTKYDNLEAYVGVSYKMFSFKYSYALSNFFGVNKDTYGGTCQSTTVGGDGNDCFGADPGKSSGSGYLDLSANFPLTEKLTLNTHVGHQSVANYSKLDYTDYKLGVTYDLNGWGLGAALVGTDAKKGWYYACKVGETSTCKKLGETTLVLSVAKSF